MSSIPYSINFSYDLIIKFCCIPHIQGIAISLASKKKVENIAPFYLTIFRIVCLANLNGTFLCLGWNLGISISQKGDSSVTSIFIWFWYVVSVLAIMWLLWRANCLTSMINFVSYSTSIHWKLMLSLTQFYLQELENTIHVFLHEHQLMQLLH